MIGTVGSDLADVSLNRAACSGTYAYSRIEGFYLGQITTFIQRRKLKLSQGSDSLIGSLHVAFGNVK